MQPCRGATDCPLVVQLSNNLFDEYALYGANRQYVTVARCCRTWPCTCLRGCASRSTFTSTVQKCRTHQFSTGKAVCSAEGFGWVLVVLVLETQDCRFYTRRQACCSQQYCCSQQRAADLSLYQPQARSRCSQRRSTRRRCCPCCCTRAAATHTSSGSSSRAASLSTIARRCCRAGRWALRV